MPTPIQDHRDKQENGQALRLLVKACKSPKAADHPDLICKLLRKHLLRRCLVLDWAEQQFQQKQRSQCSSLLDELEEHVLPKMEMYQGQFLSRINLIRAASNEQKSDACESAIRKYVAEVEEAWEYTPCDYIQSLQSAEFAPTPNDTRSGPMFLWNLDASYRRLLQDLAREYGWLHPGMLLAGETLAIIEGKSPTSSHSVRTKLLFAFEDRQDCFGVHADLAVRRVKHPQGQPGGRGFVIPDARTCGYLSMQNSFSLGLQHATYAAWISRDTTPICDLRWSIDLERAVRKTTLQSQLRIPLTGHSGESLLTCALRAAAQGRPMDRNTSMSARLDLPIERSLAVQPIDELDVKCLAPKGMTNTSHFRKQSAKHQIHRILVSHLQPDADRDTGSGHEFKSVRSVYEAEQEFQLWPTMTQAVKRSLARRAASHREALCGREPASEEGRREDGCSYVQSPLEYLPERMGEPSNEETKTLALKGEDVRRFVLAKWRPPEAKSDKSLRIRLFADSGMGKSVQLVVCEEKIAKRSDRMIPIRIGKSHTHLVRNEQLRGSTSIASIDWGRDTRAVLESLLDSCLLGTLPSDCRAHGLEWIERKAENGEIVFLIDALDQTADDLEAMAKFLARLPRCRVIAAGRPESAHTRGSLFGQQTWWTCQLLKLSRPQQRDVLGRWAAELVFEHDSEGEDTRWEHRDSRKHLWKELLGTPMLLQMLKRLAQAGQHHDSRNRFDIYNKAVKELIEKGLDSRGESRELSSSPAIMGQKQQLQRLALYMTQLHEFDVLEGKSFDQWQVQSTETDLKDLVQVDIVTMHGLLDRITQQRIEDRTGTTEPGIEWRHRSFQEYFAGRELASLWMSGNDQERQQVKDILSDVHRVLNNGLIRSWKRWESRKQQYVNTFRDLPQEWSWVLRFMLCALDEELSAGNDGQSSAQIQRAVKELVELGNPGVVMDCVSKDGLVIDQDMERVCRWMLRQEGNDPPNAKQGTVGVVPSASAWTRAKVNTKTLLDRSTRDADWLHSIRLLVGDDVLRSFYQTTSGESSLLEQVSQLSGGSDQTACWDFFESLIPVDGGRFELSPYHQTDMDKGLVPKSVEIQSFQLADFPVTNELFELFCPTHRRRRNQFSAAHNQPVTYVCGHMANEFCQWLSALANQSYRLPTEWEWEWACRWRNTLQDKFWWGPDEPSQVSQFCWYGASSGGSATTANRTRSRSEAMHAYQIEGKRHASGKARGDLGLLDLAGNGWECLGVVCEWLSAEGAK